MKTAQAIALASAIALSPLSLLPAASVHAEPVSTINLTDIPDIDSLPVCGVEDCSDQPGQVGLWLDKDTGNWYLERGDGQTAPEQTWLIIDNTVR